MRKQKGAALIIVMVLLTVSLMLGLSSVQSSLIDERLAGNYREYTLAYSEAEAGVAKFARFLHGGALANGATSEGLLSEPISMPDEVRQILESCNDSVSAEAKNSALEAWKSDVLEKLEKYNYALEGVNSLGNIDWELEPYPAQVKPATTDEHGNCIPPSYEDDPAFWLVSTGRYGREGSQAERTVRALFEIPASVEGGLFSGLMSCENVKVAGSGSLDSYDSQAGNYGVQLADGTLNSKRSNLKITTQVDGASVELNNNATVYGNVSSAGGLKIIQSSLFGGEARANGNIEVNSWAQVFGDFKSKKDIAITGQVNGNVYADGKVIVNNGRLNGNATAATKEDIDYPSYGQQSDFITGSANSGGAGFDEASSVKSTSECNDAGVEDYYKKYVSEYSCPAKDGTPCLFPSGNVVLTKHGIDGKPDYTVGQHNVDGMNVTVMRFDKFNKSQANGGGSVVIGRKEEPVNAVLIIDSSDDDISIGNDLNLKVSPGSTLQIITRGKFSLQGGSVIGGDKPSMIDDNGYVVPVLSLISTYHDDDVSSGINIGNDAIMYGRIIAPFSNVTFNGGAEFYGSINSRSLDMSNDFKFHYDERLGEVPPLSGGSGVSGSDSEPQIKVFYEALK